MRRTLRVQEQRDLKAHRQMVTIGLECELQLLIADILKGETNKLADFQQMVQFAPSEMKLRLLDKLEKTR